MEASVGIRGAGLGLRRTFMRELAGAGEGALGRIDFLEIAPENWIDVGGRSGRGLREFAERFPFVCHGLSLSLGGPLPLDIDFLRAVKKFLDTHRIRFYSEHLSACSDHGHLYDLMPIPFTAEAVRYVAERIRRVQDVLERRIGIENVSCYATPGAEMTELEFINAVLQEADCLLLLDVNNIYVNSVNFGYDPSAFLRGLHGDRAAYIHVAGHRSEAEDLRVDTHGAAVIDPVWRLLDEAYALYGALPTLLERDFNMPPLPALLDEVDAVRAAQQRCIGVPERVGAEQKTERTALSPKTGGAAAAQPRSVRDFQQVQREFAAYIRNPERNRLPAGVEARRADLYARLFYNNIESFLARTFRTMRRIVDDAAWHAVVRGFVDNHRAESPYFSHIPEEFLAYLATLPTPTTAQGGSAEQWPPFALELCHYEWVKSALALAPDADLPKDDKAIESDDRLALSPLAWPLRYAFPVRRLGPDFQPATAPAQATHLIAYRDRGHEVRFMSSNAATARLLELLGERESVRECIEAIAAELGAPLAAIERFGLATLHRLQEHDIVHRR